MIVKIKQILFKIYKMFFYIMGVILPKKKNQIIFESFLGKQYSDNPRAIYEYLSTHRPELKMYWSATKESATVFDKYDVIYVKRFSLKWMLLMNTSKYWVTNSRLPLWIPKPKGTTYVQTWHGTPLKKLALDMEEVYMPGTTTSQYKKNFTTEVKKWDILLSPNAYSTAIFKKAFNFKKEILELGYPRNDYLINNNNSEHIKKIKKKFNLPEDKKILLYAPTWRDNEFYNVGKYKFNLQLDLQLLKKELGEEYIVLLRLHYLISSKVDTNEYNGFVYNFSHTEDIRELYLIADVLITDYSSVFFDYANLKKPIIFFVYDIEEYRNKLRGFYFDLEKKAPGELVKNTAEIIEMLREDRLSFLNNDKYREFYQEFCYLEDGKVSERVSEIFKKE